MVCRRCKVGQDIPHLIVTVEELVRAVIHGHVLDALGEGQASLLQAQAEGQKLGRHLQVPVVGEPREASNRHCDVLKGRQADGGVSGLRGAALVLPRNIEGNCETRVAVRALTRLNCGGHRGSHVDA